MTKQEQFLWAVQTIVLANAVNLASQPELAERHRADISVTGLWNIPEEALRASELIPGGMTASKAAGEFCEYTLRNLRPEGAKVPGWFARS